MVDACGIRNDGATMFGTGQDCDAVARRCCLQMPANLSSDAIERARLPYSFEGVLTVD
jgi:hypothetical protein